MENDAAKKVMDELEKEDQQNEVTATALNELLKVSSVLAKEIAIKGRTEKPTPNEIKFLLEFTKFTLTLY